MKPLIVYFLWSCVLMGLLAVTLASAPPKVQSANHFEPQSKVRNNGALPAVAAKAKRVLENYCYRCHGKNGAAKGRFGYVLDRDKLVARNKIIPGNAKASPLYQRVHKGEMPPSAKKPRPSKSDLADLRQWIDAGAPGFEASKPRKFVAKSQVLQWIYDDLQTIPSRHRRFARYFTLVHLANAGISEKDLEAARLAVGKLVNNLSWHPRITKPLPIDKGRLVFRIDLRHYKWRASLWDRIVTEYPYRFDRDFVPDELRKATLTELPYLRGDWFVANASQPPLYHDLLEVPATDRGLERLVQVDVQTNIREETAIRAGFNNSGVSQNNRLIERHDSAYGAYWRSYDFAKNTERQNLFRHPLGPAAGATSFAHAGGESIFELPNGLHGYLLSDAIGRRIDKGPIDIVSDPRRPDRSVTTGISCMSCHARGFIPKADEIRAHVLKNAGVFTKDEVGAIRALYLPNERMRKLLDEDNRRYQQALAEIGISLDDPEPVNDVTQRYEATMDQSATAAELGLTPGEFLKRLQRAPSLARDFGALKDKSGSIQRQVFEDNYDELIEALKTNRTGAVALNKSTKTERKPFIGHTGSVLSIAFSPDGKLAVSGGADRTVRLWDVAGGKELRLFKGHSDEVTAVCFTPDGKWVLSGSRDRSIRLWNVESGKMSRRFIGHTDTIRSVAVSCDGKMAISGGDDRAIRIWDLKSGKELRAFAGHSRSIRRVVFSPNRRQAASAGLGGTVRLWDVRNGREIRSFAGHAGAVYDIAFSPDSRRILSGGNDKCVRLWDVNRGRQLLCLQGHANAVICVAFSPNGRHAYSASSRYQSADRVLRKWDLKGGRLISSLENRSNLTVGCATFAPDGGIALTGGSEGMLHMWRW